MNYKTVLVCLTNPHNAKRMSKIGANLARKFGSHLVGLHTLQSIDVYPGITVPVSSEFEENFTKDQLDQAHQIENIFRENTDCEDFVSEWRCVEAGSVDAADRIIEHARCADLIVVPQADKQHDRPDQTTLQRDIIEAAGRPVLVIPKYGEFDKIGDNILVGWSATKEASRSVHDAIPFMQTGNKTNVFWISKLNSQETYLAHSANEIATALDRNGVKVNVIHRVNTGLPIGDEILNEAADTGADLIVSGAYGHSRIYDFMVGATTPHLMKHMTVPVLFSC
ncbi:MAG: universal stress protein [Rhizobiaceae bacterium]|nr:universal stress protein [Rhizobiaceae bacterium]